MGQCTCTRGLTVPHLPMAPALPDGSPKIIWIQEVSDSGTWDTVEKQGWDLGVQEDV